MTTGLGRVQGPSYVPAPYLTWLWSSIAEFELLHLAACLQGGLLMLLPEALPPFAIVFIDIWGPEGLRGRERIMRRL